MHPNAALIQRFYERFQLLDPEGMAACYTPDVVFSDPAFGELRGMRAGDMWRMLAGRAQDLKITVSDIRADETTGSARWIATYTFGKTGRKVRNVIEARFTFKDGLIASHRDSFSFWKWSRQALGAPGLFLGWTSLLQGKVRAEALKGLDAFVAKKTVPA